MRWSSLYGLLFFFFPGWSQPLFLPELQVYRVEMLDKSDKPDTVQLDSKAKEKRYRLRIPLSEPDWIRPRELDAELLQGAAYIGYSRYLNCYWVEADTRWAARAVAFPQVKRLVADSIQLETASLETYQNLRKDDADVRKLAGYQIGRMGGDLLKSRGLDGAGIRIAILDAGFKDAREAKALQHIWKRNGIIASYDFVRNDTQVFRSDVHGTLVWSAIAGIFDSIPLGFAPEAEFLLARTESSTREGLREEARWVMALEWAEQWGADLVNSSLGYTSFSHFQEDLDGTSPMSEAIDVATQKGVLVINSAGNDFRRTWKLVGIPADARTALSVGATDPYTDLQAWFSSVGPTADGRLKPELSAPGTIASCLQDRLVKVSGTSFSAPLVTGWIACILQEKTDLNPDSLRQLVMAAGHLYPYFDYAHGYGVPLAKRILDIQPSTEIPGDYFTDTLDVIVCYPQISDTAQTYYLYFHIADSAGWIYRYGVMELKKNNPIVICKKVMQCLDPDLPDDFLVLQKFHKRKSNLPAGPVTLRLFYRGTYYEKVLNE